MQCLKSACRCKIGFMRIAIVKLSALGDIVHAMIVLQFIKKLDKKISIDWVVDRSYKELLECNPDINEVHTLDIQKAKRKKSILAIIKELNKVRSLYRYDLVIDMQGLIKSAIISKLIPSINTLGFDRFSARERLASVFYNKTFNCSYETNVIERNLSLMEYALGVSFKIKEIHNKVPFLFSNEQILKIPITKPKKNILIIPGASHDSTLSHR